MSHGNAQQPGLPSTLVEVVAANIRAECALRGISQTELANGIGMGRTAVVLRWWGHKRQWQLEDIERVAAYLDINPAELCLPRERPKYGFAA